MATDSLRRFLRRGAPLRLRQLYAQARRLYRDSVSGTRFHFESGGGDWPIRTELIQIVIQGQLYENKLSNLRRGAAMIDQPLINPAASGHFGDGWEAVSWQRLCRWT